MNKVYKIILKYTDEVLGYGGLCYVTEFKEIEITYGLKEVYWKQGFASEVSLRLKKHAIELGHTHVIALADVDNIASQKVLLKTGYTQLKQIHLWGSDLYYYEMDI